MNRSGFAENQSMMESAMLTDGAEEPVQGATAEPLTSDPAMGAHGGRAPLQTAECGNAGGVHVTLLPLQRLIEEILEPLAVGRRTVKEWRSLYRAFFAFFGPGGGADEAERGAWKIAADVFNTNLAAVRNRTNQIVPMTYQDFIDGVDSFRHDGLREGAQRDIAWQPKKILLLMAAMIGRIVAGRHADIMEARGLRQELSPFRKYLIEENRKAAFLGYVFNYDPRFSILEYQAAGLDPLLRSCPQFACALMENGIDRCEFCAPQAGGSPPLLQVHFRKPLRAPLPSRTISSVHLVLLHNPQSLARESQPSDAQSSYFEYSRTVLDALAFEPAESGEVKCSKIERLFGLALVNGLRVCGPHRAATSTAAALGRTLGRTQPEQFVIERFFALGFRNGCGNEPWLDEGARESPELDPEKVQKARKQFEHWRDTSLFFLKAGQPEAAGISGARSRQEALQPKGSAFFPSLLKTPVYAPVMSVFLTADAQAKWLVDEPDLHAIARNLRGGAAKVLLEAAGAIAHRADSFQDQRKKSLFLFECAAGILMTLAGAHRSPRRQANLIRAREALRDGYEPETRATMLEADSRPAEQPAPRIQLENRTTFEESIAVLCAWVKSHDRQLPGVSPSCVRQLPAALVESPALAEQGKVTEALEQTTVLNPDKTPPQEPVTPRPARKASALPASSTAVTAPKAQGPRSRQAEILLREYTDELSMEENKLEQEFLQAVVAGSECAFKRKEKLRRRLQQRTRWGGREPYKTTLKLLESATRSENPE